MSVILVLSPSMRLLVFCYRNLFKLCHEDFTRLLAKYYFFIQFFIFLPYIKLSLLRSGDIECNPGPANADQNLSMCHWNVNGLAANNFIKISLVEAYNFIKISLVEAYNFIKISLVEAYNTIHNFDLICVSETFLNSDYSNDDARLMLPGYAMIRSDHPSNAKKGGVCIYYKEHLPFIQRDDLMFLPECIVGEIQIKNSKCFITCVYRSPSQNTNETNIFLSNFEKIWSSIALESPMFSFIMGDLNAKCSSWWEDGTNNPCGLDLHNMSTLLGYSQLINTPTNFEPNKHPSCIDLIFTNQPNLVYEWYSPLTIQ